MTDSSLPSWLEAPARAPAFEPVSQEFAFVRLWRGFMTARVMIGTLLLALQGLGYMLGAAFNPWMVGLCAGYVGATLLVRVLAQPSPPGGTFDPQWVSTIGVDLIAFTALQFLQTGQSMSMNYTPLFALPVLVAAVLGSQLLALGTAAAVTLLQLAEGWWVNLQGGGDPGTHLMQAGLAGTGFFMLALMVGQLSARLAREEARARSSQAAARMQAQVNEVVIETLNDGVLVVDVQHIARAANPAARALLCPQDRSRRAPFALDAERSWRALATLAERTFAEQAPQVGEVLLEAPGQAAQRVHVRTRLTDGQGWGEENLCVMFLEDLREMEARIRTEKLAAMGRMSVAVAHEIRNPLAAITQANALLDEDLQLPAQRQLTAMVHKNALRLTRIVEDVLDVSRVEVSAETLHARELDLLQAVPAICRDWSTQNQCPAVLRPASGLDSLAVHFDEDHLHRVLVNLLDNALRHAERAPDAIQVQLGHSPDGVPQMAIWSRGPQIERSVQARLFEPFFSSDSRSSGLGLFICRELCMRHGASIAYRRHSLDGVEGNEFVLGLRASTASLPHAGSGPLFTGTQAAAGAAA